MKNIILILCLVGGSCCGQKKAGGNLPNEETGKIQNPALSAVPACVGKLIEKFSAEEKQNPPRKIFSYSYKGKTVYYVPAICCDFFSDLYDAECNLIGHPDGGFTGKGDGKIPDFDKERSNEMLLWEDKRK